MIPINNNSEIETRIDISLKTETIEPLLYWSYQNRAEVLFESLFLDPDGHLLSAVVMPS